MAFWFSAFSGDLVLRYGISDVRDEFGFEGVGYGVMCVLCREVVRVCGFE